MSFELNEAKNKFYTITIDPTSQKVKPKNDYEFSIICNKIKTVVSLTIDEFIKKFSAPLSYTWFGGTLKDYPINNENWESQSIFAIDFDKGLITVEDAIQRLKSIEINPQVWYKTLSDSEKLRKFRIVIFLENPITTTQHHELIITGLLTLFPEADQVCKNRSRFYLGGKEAFILDYIPNSTQKVIDILATIIISSDGGRTRKTPKDLAPVNSTNTGENRYLLYNRYRNYQNNPKHTISIQGGKDSTRIDWELARKKVRILNEFLNGTWLTHNQLLGLATNLIMIRGGQKLMNETMQKFNEEGKTNYTPNNFAILPYIKKVNYYPQLIKNFSPYTEDADLFDIVSATIEVRGQIEEVEEIKKIPLEDAETLFKSSFEKVMTEGVSGKIYLFKLPTAIGKTASITSCVATTIATPTNDLKNEISTRMEVEHECSPDEVIFENEELNRKLNYYYSIGLPKKATAVIHDVVNGTGLVLNSQSDRDIANNYLIQLEKSKHTKTTVLTTHTRALHTEYSNDTLIFDEDPLNTLIAVKTMEISDLVKIKNNMKNSKDSLGYIIDYLDSINPGDIIQRTFAEIDLDELVKNISYTKIDTNVFGFFDSCYLYKDIHSPNTIYYVVRNELPKDKKVIIMSATIPIYLYQKIYGERVEVIDISDVQQMGSVTQYTQRSCSRNGLKSYHQSISEMVGEKPVITFKAFQNQFKNPVSKMYFGNCSGYDSLKGKDIVVVGTPHRDVIQYFLIARVLGIEIKITDSTMTHQKIEYNGFKFMFCCFDNEELRNIQLSLIESDLIQAVGRARTLRTKAKVEVYSNFPLRISNSFEY